MHGLILGMAFISSMLAVGLFRYIAEHVGLIDIPNHRSAHTLPTPRGGGIAFCVIWLIASLLAVPLSTWPAAQAIAMLPGALLIAVVGFLDDFADLSARRRLVIQFIIAIFTVIALHGLHQINLVSMKLHLGILGGILLTLAIVWSINLFNFMDGLDGLTGIEALFIFSVGGYLLWHNGGVHFAMIAWILSASIAGFLVWNFPPSSIFMGDVGSYFLGYLVILFAIIGEKWYGVPALIWFILYGLFITDATVTLIRRIIAGEKFYEAHKLHSFQRLHQSGWSQRQILMGVISINFVLGCIAIFTLLHPQVLIPAIFVSYLFLGVIYYAIERAVPMYNVGRTK